jgi:hypothetical protein
VGIYQVETWKLQPILNKRLASQKSAGLSESGWLLRKRMVVQKAASRSERS